MEREFSVGGRNFKLCKIDAFKQFHIVRRVGPLLSDLLPVMKDTVKLQQMASESEKLDQVAKLVAPVMTGLAKLSDKDADLVLFGLLSSVEVQQAAGNWAKVSTESMLMIQDMELPVLIQLAGRAFMYNIAGFFSALPRQT